MWRALYIVCVLLFLTASGHPTTHLVRPDGTGEWPTIRAANDGGTIPALLDRDWPKHERGA